MKFAKNFQVLTEDEMYLLHMRIMEVLDKIGIAVEEEQSLQLLEKCGARVDYEQKRAYMPPNMVKHALETKQDSWMMYDSELNRCFPMGGDQTSYAPLGYSTTYVETDGTVHDGTYDALLRESKLVEAIPELDCMHPSIQPTDKDPEEQDLYMLKAMLVGTKKPIHCVANSEKNAEAFAMMHAEMVGGLDVLRDKPRHMFNLCTFSPLGIRRDCCEVIRVAAKYNIPCMFSTGTMAGATAPVTLAGSMVESMAEVLGHIVLAQCYRPGLACGMLHASRIFDMKYAACTVATPEFYIMKVAACQLANDIYKIPTSAIALCADSNDYDVQYGWEKFATSFIPRMTKMHMIFGAGMYSQLNQFGFTSLALDAEIIRVQDRIRRGMEVNEETVKFELLEREYKNAGFIYDRSTTKGWKDEFMVPILSDRAPYGKFMKREGKDSLVDRANAQLEKYEQDYSYTKGFEHEDELQKIIDEYTK